MKTLLLGILVAALAACSGPYFEYREDSGHPQAAPIDPAMVRVIPHDQPLDIPPVEAGVIDFDRQGLTDDEAMTRLRRLAADRGCDVLVMPAPGHHAAKCMVVAGHPVEVRRF